MENEDLKITINFEDLEFEDLEEEDELEVEDLKTIDQYFDQRLKDSPINVKVSEYNLEQAMQGDNAPTISLANKFLLKAIQENVNEVRIMPLGSEMIVHFNQGEGFYKPFETNFAVKIIHPIVNIIRLNAGMGMLARDKPVIGKMRLIYQDKRKEVVIHTFPSTHGESLSLCFKDM